MSGVREKERFSLYSVGAKIGLFIYLFTHPFATSQSGLKAQKQFSITNYSLFRPLKTLISHPLYGSYALNRVARCPVLIKRFGV
jgi:hypothetical protein